MSFLSKVLGRGTTNAQDAKERAGQMMQGREDDVNAAVDKVADLADRATNGKFSGKIDEAAELLKDAAQDLGDDGENTPPAK